MAIRTSAEPQVIVRVAFRSAPEVFTPVVISTVYTPAASPWSGVTVIQSTPARESASAARHGPLAVKDTFAAASVSSAWSDMFFDTPGAS